MPMNMCVECKVGMKNVQSGVDVIEMFNTPLIPYKLWKADLYECPSCTTQVVFNFAAKPYAEHFHANFPAILKGVEEAGKWYRMYENRTDSPANSPVNTADDGGDIPF